MTCGFQLEHYRDLLDAARAGGYRFARFDRAPERGDLFLRHDVDLSLEAALVLAELEAKANVSATYFLMTRSVFYNLDSATGHDALGRLRELGHAVGLHAVHPHLERDGRFDAVLAWHNPEPEYMSAPVEGLANVMEPPSSIPTATAPTRTRAGATAARTTTLPPAVSSGSSCSPTPRSGCTRARRWARRCAPSSTPTGSGGSSTWAATGSS